MTATPPLAPPDIDRVFEAVGEASWTWLRGRRILLTGGTGFIGKWLLTTLLEADRRLELGCRVVVLSRDPAGFAHRFPTLAQHPALDWQSGDVRDFTIETGRCDLVIHAATDVAARTDPLDLFDTCVQGTRRVMEFALSHQTERMLLVSSGAVYGEQPSNLAAVHETYPGAPSTTDPRSAYGEGKRASEWLARAYAAPADLDVRIARCFAFVGPYQPLDGPFAMANFLRDALSGRPIVIQGNGTALRTYLHASDMTTWLWAIALRAAPNCVYNVGGEEVVSVGELASRVTRLLGSSEPVTVLRRATAGFAPSRYVPSVSKAITELNVPFAIGLDDAILRTAAWQRAALIGTPDNRPHTSVP